MLYNKIYAINKTEEMKTEPTEALRAMANDLKYNTGVVQSNIKLVIEESFISGVRYGQSSLKIKQLEWEEDVLFADMIVSDGFSLLFYRINIIDNTLYIGDTAQSFNTIEEAKAAAQADFEKRVKECLDL